MGFGITIQNILLQVNFKKMIRVESSKFNFIFHSFIISMINQDINNADWATYAVDRKFKLLKNSVFPAIDDNFFIESSANSVTLTKQVSI